MMKKVFWGILSLIPITAFSADQSFGGKYVTESYNKNEINKSLPLGAKTTKQGFSKK
jgi:hypothetical protein